MLDNAGTNDVREILLRRLPLGQYIELQRLVNAACVPGISEALRRRKVEQIRLTLSGLKSELGLAPMQAAFWSAVFGSPNTLSVEKERHA